MAEDQHTHSGEIELTIPPSVLNGALIVMALVVTAYTVWQFFDGRKANRVFKEEMNRIVKEFKEHSPELLVSIAPQVPDDANEE